jgi:hypothetical protein
MAAGMGLGVVNAATREAEACPTVWPAPDYRTVADAPFEGCDFARFRHQSGLAELEKDYARTPAAFLDLRQQWAEIEDASSYVRRVYPLAGEPHGLEVHLAREMAACLKTV